LRVFGEVPDIDYCATAPVVFFLKVSVSLPFAAFGAENQIDKRVGLKIRGPQRKKCPILSGAISGNQAANSSLKCNTLKRLMCLHEYRLQTSERG
jgi:hypothetical protein